MILCFTWYNYWAYWTLMLFQDWCFSEIIVENQKIRLCHQDCDRKWQYRHTRGVLCLQLQRLETISCKIKPFLGTCSACSLHLYKGTTIWYGWARGVVRKSWSAIKFTLVLVYEKTESFLKLNFMCLNYAIIIKIRSL